MSALGSRPCIAAIALRHMADDEAALKARVRDLEGDFVTYRDLTQQTNRDLRRLPGAFASFCK